MLEPSGRCVRRVYPRLRCLVNRSLHKHLSPPDSSPLPAVLTCVTGVAGSGKCSLVAGLIDTLRWRPTGVGRGSEVVVVDQRPGGRSFRFQPRHLRRRVRPHPAGVPLRQPGLAQLFSFNAPRRNRPEGTRISQIDPAVWRHLPNLRKLKIGSNRILTLPRGFFRHLTRREELDMYDMCCPTTTSSS